MGMAKQQMMENMERGFSLIGDQNVCYKCFDDEDIKKFINSNATAQKCDYCGEKNSKKYIAMPIDEVVDFIHRSLSFEYNDPVEELMYISKEGGYQGKTIDTWDLLWDELQIIDDSSSPVFETICSAISDHTPSWCKKDFYGMSDSEVGEYTWKKFKDLVLCKARYMFLKVEPEKDQYDDHWEKVTPPLKILNILKEYVIEIGLVETLPANKILYRVRLDAEEKFTTLDDIGTSPLAYAKYSNRMSPAGISMFYAANDFETAIAETWDGDGKPVASIGKFEITEESTIINLSKIPAVPSIFNEERRELRETLKFLHAFRKDFSKPIIKDGREHVDYVPTQIVTEYFRHIFKLEGKSIEGICYPSSKNLRHDAYVFFWGHKDDKYFNPNLLGDKCRLLGVEYEKCPIKT